MQDEMEEMNEMTDEDFNRILEIIARLCERCSGTGETVEAIRGLKVSDSDSIATAVLKAIAVLAEKCKTIEDFRKSLAEVLAEE